MSKAVDWDAIKPLYEAGKDSVRALARQFSISDAGLTKHAKAAGWVRPVSTVVRAPAPAQVSAPVIPPTPPAANRADRLTAKQEAFCLAYLTEPDASKAYRKAYDAENMGAPTVWASASALLADHKVAVRIAELRKAAAVVAVVDEAQVIREAARLGLSDVGLMFDDAGDLLPIKQLPPEIRACIASVEIEEKTRRDPNDPAQFQTYRVKKVKLWDKNSAIEKLMKHLGSYEIDNRQRAGLFDDWSPAQRKDALNAVQQAIAKAKAIA